MKIKNAKDLRIEIARLTLIKEEQEAYLKDQYNLLSYKLNAPARFFNRVVSFFPGSENNDLTQSIFSFINPGKTKTESNSVSRGLRLLVPFLLNRTFLKKAGWIKKGLVLLASDSVLGNIDRSKIEHAFDYVVNLIKPKKNKRKKTNADGTQYDEFDDTPFAGDMPAEKRKKIRKWKKRARKTTE